MRLAAHDDVLLHGARRKAEGAPRRFLGKPKAESGKPKTEDRESTAERTIAAVGPLWDLAGRRQPNQLRFRKDLRSRFRLQGTATPLFLPATRHPSPITRHPSGADALRIAGQEVARAAERIIGIRNLPGAIRRRTAVRTTGAVTNAAARFAGRGRFGSGAASSLADAEKVANGVAAATRIVAATAG
jgi:hypothetical protein